MKSAIKRILASLMGIGVLACGPVFAQYYPSQYRERLVSPKAYRMAQQSNNPGVAFDIPPDSVKRGPPSDGTGNAKPGELFPDLMPPGQSPESGSVGMLGVENGLWDGCEPGDCCTVCGGGYCTPPLWYTEQGARVLARSSPRKLTLGSFELPLVSTSGTTTTLAGLAFIELLNTRTAGYNVAPGYNATLGRYLGRDSQGRDDFLEFAYWGMNTWLNNTTAALGREEISLLGVTFTAGRLVTPLVNSQWNAFSATQQVPEHPFGAGGFDFVESQKYIIESEIHNWELNLRLRPRGRPDQLVLHPNGRWQRECQPGAIMSYLVGLRYITFGDGFRFHSEGTVDQGGVSYFTSADYNVQTENDLLGLQFGADLTFRKCKWNWGIRAKIGPYINFSNNERVIVNAVPGGYPLSNVIFDDRFVSRKQNPALLGEVGFTATYQFKPNLSARAAYDFMWITGLALAPEQVEWSYAPVARINTNGNIFSHGATLGLEWCW